MKNPDVFFFHLKRKSGCRIENMTTDNIQIENLEKKHMDLIEQLCLDMSANLSYCPPRQDRIMELGEQIETRHALEYTFRYGKFAGQTLREVLQDLKNIKDLNKIRQKTKSGRLKAAIQLGGAWRLKQLSQAKPE